jgi:hypothetical protein
LDPISASAFLGIVGALFGAGWLFWGRSSKGTGATVIPAGAHFQLTSFLFLLEGCGPLSESFQELLAASHFAEPPAREGMCLLLNESVSSTRAIDAWVVPGPTSAHDTELGALAKQLFRAGSQAAEITMDVVRVQGEKPVGEHEPTASAAIQTGTCTILGVFAVTEINSDIEPTRDLEAVKAAFDDIMSEPQTGNTSLYLFFAPAPDETLLVEDGKRYFWAAVKAAEDMLGQQPSIEPQGSNSDVR